MTVVGFFRTFSLGIVLLLLATTTTLMPRASAISSDVNGTSEATTSDADDCSTELTTCQADAVCQSCSTAASSSVVSDSCYTFNPTTTTSQGCDLQLDAVCCLVGLSEFDCLENDAFVALSTCHIESFGCTEAIACDGDEYVGATGTASLGYGSAFIAFSCAFVVMVQLLWVGS